MFSDLYSIIFKGGRYAQDIEGRLYWESPNRVRFTGNNDTHLLTRRNGSWQCDCSTYQRYVLAGREPICPHVKALELSGAEFQEEVPGERHAYAFA